LQYLLQLSLWHWCDRKILQQKELKETGLLESGINLCVIVKTKKKLTGSGGICMIKYKTEPSESGY